MTRSVSALVLVVLCTACPETWRKGGRIDRALAKDVKAEWRDRQLPSHCALSEEEWEEQCAGSEDWEESNPCHRACEP
ncbi:hypothetical protein CYFUS_009785 [Cystobacter fuscus]|uniref:Uncharacterized protein n=1 Tax=Cystobacter fuscus TaxID=43 RepID=A0A250JKZ1_9BACT|nr:hypothetical protein CYFUS_009785 [Cystobacter fuscus]